MKKFSIRTGYAVSLVFAGVAVLEFLRTNSWTAVGYFGILAVVFLLLDSRRQAAGHP